MISNIGKPFIWSTDVEDEKNYLDKSTADVLYMNTNEPYTNDLDMTGHKIVNVGDPVNDKDVVHKKYVEDNYSLTNYARRDELTTLATKTELEQFVTKNQLADNDRADQQYVNRKVNTRLPLSGGTMTGDINMSDKKITNVAEPTSDKDATNKKYITDTLGNYIRKNEVETLELVTRTDLTTYDNNNVVTRINTKLPLSGGTMTGAINMNQNRISGLPNPINVSECATMGYVNESLVYKLNNYGGNMTGDINMTTNRIVNMGDPEQNHHAATKKYVDDGLSLYTDIIESKLSLSGGTMTGNINMNSKKITALVAPTDDNDAVRKQYVDKNFIKKLHFQVPIPFRKRFKISGLKFIAKIENIQLPVIRNTEDIYITSSLRFQNNSDTVTDSDLGMLPFTHVMLRRTTKGTQGQPVKLDIEWYVMYVLLVLNGSATLSDEIKNNVKLIIEGLVYVDKPSTSTTFRSLDEDVVDETTVSTRSDIFDSSGTYI